MRNGFLRNYAYKAAGTIFVLQGALGLELRRRVVCVGCRSDEIDLKILSPHEGLGPLVSTPSRLIRVGETQADPFQMTLQRLLRGSLEQKVLFPQG